MLNINFNQWLTVHEIEKSFNFLILLICATGAVCLRFIHIKTALVLKTLGKKIAFRNSINYV